MKLPKLCGSLVLAICLASCTHMANDDAVDESSEAAFVLANSSWQLAKIASGATETTRVDPGLYTLLIRSDGTAAFGLDCNRGFGRWEGAATNGATNGTIRFSEIGTTRALCPPGSISDQVTVDLGRFRSFEEKDSQLILTTEGEGPIYYWEAATEYSNASGT